MKMSRILPLLAAAACLAPAAATAGIIYTYEGSCTHNCDEVSLEEGALVSGSITAADGSLDDGVLDWSELIDFSFSFGSLVFNFGDATVWGSMHVDGDGFDSTLGNFTFRTNDPFGAANTGLLFGLSGWTARDTACGGIFAGVCVAARTASGPGGYTKAVPEPGTLALLGLGMLGLGLSRRRKAAAA